MRELRQDEIDLVNRVRKRDAPIVTAVKKLTLATKRMGRALTVDEVSTDPSDSLPHRFPGLLEINDHPLFHPEKILNEPVHREPSPNIPVPMENLPQEDTLDQIKRMIDNLPENHFCEISEGECKVLMDLMISKWAREFLLQLIREHEGRVKC